MNKRKYPLSMFIMGAFLKLIPLRHGFIIIVILWIMSLINPIVPKTMPIVLIAFLVLIAIMQQLRDRKIMLSQSDNEETNELLDKMFADNSNGYRNITEAIDEIIRNNESDKNNIQ